MDPYKIEIEPREGNEAKEVSWRRQESNLRLVACEATTLPLSYTPFTSNYDGFFNL